MIAALTTNVTRFFREPHHFEHLKTNVLPPLLDAARGGRARAHLVGGLLDRPGALFDRADDPVADAGRRRATTCSILATDHRPERRRARRGRRLSARGARRRPADMRAQWFEPVPATARQLARRSTRSRSLVAFRELNLIGTLADARAVRRHLLPQRRDLFRRDDAERRSGGACPACCRRRRSLYRPFRARHRPGIAHCSTATASPPIASERQARAMKPVRVLVVDDSRPCAA